MLRFVILCDTIKLRKVRKELLKIINYNLIKKRRKELSISGQELGDMIGVSKQTISKYENGSINIKNDTLAKICDILSIDMNEIYGREKVPTNIVKEKGNNIKTIAAHHDDDDWSEGELLEIEMFKKFIIAKRYKE